MRSRIFIVGAGVVGAATGKGLASAGHRVRYVDVSPARVDALRARGWDAGTDLDLAGEPSSLIFLTLPTPSREDGYDLSALAAGTATVGRALSGATDTHTVVVRSTVPPGTTEGLVGPVLEKHSGSRVGAGFEVVCNPEFLRAATADRDFAEPWMTVVGGRNPAIVRGLADLLAPFGGELRTFDDPAAAELVKCAHNLFNATKISFWNEMWLVARRLGVDLDAVAGTVAASAEGSTNPLYGIRGGAPFGGMCLPKDTAGFLAFADEAGVDTPLLRAVIEVNQRMAAVVAGEVDTAATLAGRR